MFKKIKGGVATFTPRYTKQEIEKANTTLKMCDRVFVYGSLKKDGGNDSILDSCGPPIQTQTIPSFVLGDIGFPYAFSQGTTPEKYKRLLHPVKGELYTLDCEDKQKVFISLDRLEGYPAHYNRVIIKTVSGHKAWMYTQEDWNCASMCAPCKLEKGVWEWTGF